MTVVRPAKLCLLAVMLSHAILLTGEREFGPLRNELRRYNPALDVRHARNRQQLEQHLNATGFEARLIGFTTSVIVPPALIRNSKLKPYNFHPGPPHYPGRYPEAWGLYNDERRFGATAHEMAELVDSGPIVDVEYFDIPPGIDRFTMGSLCFEAVAKLFHRLASQLAIWTSDLPTKPQLQWSGRKWRLADFEAMRDHPPIDDHAEAQRRVRAFGHPAGHPAGQSGMAK